MNGSEGTRQNAGSGCPPGGDSAGRAQENPWFLITYNEILEIQERLRDIEAELPKTSVQPIGEIRSILRMVRDRLT